VRWCELKRCHPGALHRAGFHPFRGTLVLQCELASMRIADHLLRWLVAVGLVIILTGCNQSEGSVQVDVGSAPQATAYRVDLYAREAGLDLVEGVDLTGTNQVTLDSVQTGKWALLIQALDGNLATISYFQAQIEVHTDQTTSVTAGTYIPGTPRDTLLDSSTKLTSFGPDGDALLTALYSPDLDSLPPANVALELISGEGQAVSDDTTVANRAIPAGGVSLQCGTCFISEHDVQQGNQVRGQVARPPVGSINPGETLDFFILTTFQTATCQRILTDAQTEHCLVFAEVIGGTPVISEATALAVAQGFDSDNPFQDGDSGLYNDTRERLGSEWKVDGGRDGDERVVFVFLSSGTIGGAGLFGFFSPTDQSSGEENASSNAGEILYLNADRSEADVYDALGTISHEFCHLILFNQKVGQDGTFPEGARPENAVLDEGLAVLNEELSGFTYTGDMGGNFFLLSAVSNVLEEGLNRRFFQFGGRLGDYGAGYLFWRYVHDQLGIATIKTLATSTGTGRANIETVLQEPFFKFFQRFTQAVALAGRTDTPEDLMFTDLDLFGTYPSREGTVFELNGLQDVRTVTLPGTLQVDVALEPWGTIFYQATGGDGSGLTWKATGIDSLVTGLVPLVNAK
jgi:hypothetical protein